MNIDMTGSCQFFDPKPFMDAANILAAADEPLRALQVLDSLPGFYRDHRPTEIAELKAKIYGQLATPTFYQHEKPSPRYESAGYHDDVALLFSEYVQSLVRGQVILRDVQLANDRGETPNILDLGPGEYWLPIGMDYLGGRFRYRGVGLCDANETASRPYLSGVPSDFAKADIFVACELIEHLHHEEDIRTEFERHAPGARIVHISTPKYTYDGRAESIAWETKGGLGHLRTYTPKEFFNVVQGMFPEFRFDMVDSQILHLRGER